MNPTTPDTHPSNQLWQQLAPQRLQLMDTVTINSLSYRGQKWFVLRNQLGHQQLRINQRIYQVLSRLDGQLTLAQAAEPLLSEELESARKSLLGALLQLHSHGMLASDAPHNLQALVEQQKRRQRQKSLSHWFRLLSPRLPLVDPDQFLSQTVSWVSWMLHPLTLLILMLIILSAGVTGLMQMEALSLYASQRMGDPQSWLLLICLYPLIKGLHELGHGYTAKAAGVDVNEMGVTFLVFVPVPYVDASAATVLPSKHWRMLISAAGIIVELLLTSMALFAWISLSDGLLREAAFATMIIGGISTLLFNGNPLLRFDGYYVFSDAIEIPNLATRSARYYGYLFKRYLFGLKQTKAPTTATGERPWFLFYGASATLYRLMISIGIAVFLINSIPVLGSLLAAWMLTVQILLPLARHLHYLLFNDGLTEKRLRAVLTTSSLAAVLIMIVTLLPLPQRTIVDGIILMPEQAVIRAEIDGFLQQQVFPDNTTVKQGDVLFSLSDPQLDAEIAELKALLDELQASHDALGIEERVERDIKAQRLSEAQTDLAELGRRHASLDVISPADGTVRIALNQDYKGRLVRQGDLLGYVSNQEKARIRVVATQENASKIRTDVEQITVRMADAESPVLVAELLGEVPAGSDTLPSTALGSYGGGKIMVDGRDQSGLKTLHNIYAFEITVPHTASAEYIGSRAHVRFKHSASPMFSGIKDDVRRFFLDELGA